MTTYVNRKLWQHCLILFIYGVRICSGAEGITDDDIAEGPYAIVLGTAQDGGFPQAGCRRECCVEAWHSYEMRRYVSCLAIVDPISQQRWMLDCTPDFRDQLRLLHEATWDFDGPLLDGVFPTHAHVGHYTGLMHLGREILGAIAVPVYVMPRMKYFLETNGPWSQLVELNQVELRRIAAGEEIKLNERLSVTPFLVPHRDEYSETVGFRVSGPRQTLIYLPDIDKWERWQVRIEDMVAEADVALVDGTFYADGELPLVDMSLIPHPFISESLARFESLPDEERRKIRFIHLNHTNPALNPASEAARQVKQAGLGLARQGQRTPL